jgi:hypothetical protein
MVLRMVGSGIILRVGRMCMLSMMHMLGVVGSGVFAVRWCRMIMAIAVMLVFTVMH